jgi:hypothetical protein
VRSEVMGEGVSTVRRRGGALAGDVLVTHTS